ncbi:ADP-ribosylation factor-like 5A [Crotalus adamanteus]
MSVRSGQGRAVALLRVTTTTTASRARGLHRFLSSASACLLFEPPRAGPGRKSAKTEIAGRGELPRGSQSFGRLSMGILFTRIWRLFNHQEHKVIIVGLDNAGKTTILYQFSMNEVVHTSPTIGSNVEEIVVNNTRFLMWDIGGQESLRSSWNTYYTNTEFVIVVVDSTDRERISVTKEELYKMLAHEDLRKAGLLIFANKQDVKNCMTVAEISQFLKLTSIKDHQWHIQACCALTGEGLCQGLEWMMSRLKIR